MLENSHQPRQRAEIGLTDFHGDPNHATSKSILTVSVREAVMIKTERLGFEV